MKISIFDIRKDRIKNIVKNKLLEEGVDNPDEELIDRLIKERFENPRKNRDFKISLLRKVFIAYLVIILITVPVLVFIKSQDFIEKNYLKQKISNVINNTDSLDDIKLSLDSLIRNHPISFEFWFDEFSHYEKKSVNLVQIFNDIKTSYLSSDIKITKEDSDFVSKINTLSDLHEKINPFDDLDESSKRDLRGIVDKLNQDQYSIIKDEIDNITNSIREKNNLIEKYLSSSNTSLYVSIIALLFTVLATLWQLWITRKESQKKIIEDVLKTSLEKNEK